MGQKTVPHGSTDVSFNAAIAMPSTCVNIQTEPVTVSRMRYIINAAINTDDIVVPLNSRHDYGYRKSPSQSCVPSPIDYRADFE